MTPWTIQSMEFSRPEYQSGYPFPSPGDLPNLGIKPRFPTLQADSLPADPQEKPKNTGVGSLFPSLVDLPEIGIERGSPELQADSLPTELSRKPRLDEKSPLNYHHSQIVEVSGSRACLGPAAAAAAAVAAASAAKSLQS